MCQNSSHHAAKHTVTHNGFAGEEIEKMFVDAGIGGDFDYVELGKGVVFEEGGEKMERSLFMARGTKV